MDDVISRQAAINVIERNRAYIGHNMERAVGAAFIEILNCVGEDIGRLPSIQLATDTNVGTKLGTNLAQLGTDCISRQAAIDEIEYEIEMINSALDSITLDFNARERLRQRRGEAREILNSIQQLPPTQPEIIRCRECKFASGDSRICMKFDHSPIGELDFCSFAERREVTT